MEGPIRHAFVEPCRELIRSGVHGAIKQFYNVKPHEEIPATLDRIIAAGGGGLSITARECPVMVLKGLGVINQALSLVPSFPEAAGELIAIGGDETIDSDILPRLPVESDTIASVYLDGSTLTFPENVTKRCNPSSQQTNPSMHNSSDAGDSERA